MKIIEPSFEILYWPDHAIGLIEKAARNCYQSEPKGDPEKFIGRLIKSGHESVLEHAVITVKIICDRGVMAELTRHRLASFSIESTRYCNYNKKGLEFIRPCFWNDGKTSNMSEWEMAMQEAELYYMRLINQGAKPEEARSVLPNSLKATIVMTTNIREWRYIFKLRCSEKSHPQMREIMIPMREEFMERLPVIFG